MARGRAKGAYLRLRLRRSTAYFRQKTNAARSLVVCAMAAEAVVPGKLKYNTVLLDVDELFQILQKNKRDGKHQMWEMWDMIKKAKPAPVNQPPASEQCWFKCKTCSQLLSPSNPSRLYADHNKNLVNGGGVCAGLKVGAGSKEAAASEKLQQQTLDQLYGGERHSMPPGAASASTSAAASTGTKRPRLDSRTTWR